MPVRGRPISLLDLATQVSGLPRLPDNLAPRDPSNPYADYSVRQLYEFLSRYQLPRDPGASYEYSTHTRRRDRVAAGSVTGTRTAAARCNRRTGWTDHAARDCRAAAAGPRLESRDRAAKWDGPAPAC